MSLMLSAPSFMMNKYRLPIKISKLSVKIVSLKSELFERERTLELNKRESESEFEDIKNEWAIVKEEGKLLLEEKEVTDIELTFVKDESFWRSIHRKHVKEDLTDLKIRQKKCFSECQDILQKDKDIAVAAREVKQPTNLWNRTKKLFNNLMNRLPSKRESLRRQSRSEEMLSGLMADLECVKNGVDELVVKQYATYEMKKNTF